jgi:hypothetical protein
MDVQNLWLGRCLFRAALEVATLLAELHAGQVIACGWPHDDQLRKAWAIDAYTGIIRTIPKGESRKTMKPFQKFTCSLADIDIAAQRIHRRGGDHGAQVEGAGSPGRWVARFQHRPRVLADEDGVQRDCPRSRRARHRLHRHEDELMGGRHERSRVARQAPDGGATCGLGGSSSRIFVASRTVS